jgi:hypothetical protein
MLLKFGAQVDLKCCFCDKEETMSHMFFGCTKLKLVWQIDLRWMQVDHDPMDWNDELNEWRAQILKSVAAETVYAFWKYRNDTCFGKTI